MQVMSRLGANAPPYLRAAAAAAAAGTIPPLRVMALDVQLAPSDGAMRTASAAKDSVVCVACQTRLIQLGRSSGGGGSAAAAQGAGSSNGGSSSGQASSSSGSSSTVVFLLAEPPPGVALRAPPAAFEAEGAQLKFFATVR